MDAQQARLVTVGHGTLDADALTGALRAAGVTAVVDVRRFPASRRHPQFHREAMAEWLPAAGISYRWEEALGGRRRPPPDSPDSGLRNEAFRAYAAHMRSDGFRTALRAVLDGAAEGLPAVLCAESVWWRCHRRLIADTAVLVHAVRVLHLYHDGRVQEHQPTPAARRDGDVVAYDRGADRPLLG